MKICYIISDVDTSVLMDANIRAMAERAELSTIFLAAEPPALFASLKAGGYAVEFVKCRGKRDYPRVCWKLFRRFRKTDPDVIHTHLFNASMIGLTAARFAGVKKRINTRHHSVEAHLYHPHAVWYDKYINALSTHIVAITKMVEGVLVNKEGVLPEKVTVVRHGFDMTHFEAARIAGRDLRVKYNLQEGSPVIGVISRFIHWKGIQYTISAFRLVLERYPNAILVLANAAGPYESEIMPLFNELDTASYRLIGFEQEILQLYNSFDMFIHVPIGPEYEAFGQVYVEALAMGVPSIFTISGIANDFVVENENALVVPYEDPDAIASAIIKLADEPQVGQSLAERGRMFVQKSFDISNMIRGLESVYKIESGVQ